MPIKLNTYCSGFILKSNKCISKKEFVELCNSLQQSFNSYYNTNEYSFSPELINEGGIVFDNFNNTTEYKSMRIFFTDENGCRHIPLYGFINKNTKEEWNCDEDILICNNAYIGTYLKSFNNAPSWTNRELLIFKNCFENIGLFIEKLPTKKDLKGYENPSYYLKLFNKII
jgi:hypothetical protein